MDLAKAFDTVDYKILMIRGKTYDSIASYLSNRKRAVKINGHKSEYTNITMGVLQGSILGPLLFLLYSNDKIPKDSVICSADDTVLLAQANSWKERVILISKLLNEIATQLALNKTIIEQK